MFLSWFFIRPWIPGIRIYIRNCIYKSKVFRVQGEFYENTPGIIGIAEKNNAQVCNLENNIASLTIDDQKNKKCYIVFLNEQNADIVVLNLS